MFEKIKTYSCQLALFIAAGTIRADELSFAVRSRMKVGDFEPMLIPEAPGMPDEFPRLNINTPKGYRLSMSKVRIDFVIDLPLGIDEPEFYEFKENCELLCSILEEKKFKYSRVGFVKTLFEPVSNPAHSLVQEVTKISSSEVVDFSINLSMRVKVGSLICNSVYGLSNGLRSGSEKGVVIVRDINSDPSFGTNLAAVDIADFIPLANAECSLQNLVSFIEGK